RTAEGGPAAGARGGEGRGQEPRQGGHQSSGDRRGVARPPAMRPYPGDFPGVPAMHYAPELDGLPDPGEVVWTWVPFEEDPTLGKDRPVLLVGLDGDWLLGVMLTSRDHDASRGRERRAGREWVDVGSGAWDREGRESEARTDRILRVDPDAVRREGAVLDRDRFDQVAQAIRATA
ncbi:MAG: type II toxin-antitoxin system PemK/MazF family toxin, partial [Actinomycetota bacterium]|nr:type II toxin-antitoxin system PemK/MazF family toxin [Actinomycetota bacterium]